MFGVSLTALSAELVGVARGAEEVTAAGVGARHTRFLTVAGDHADRSRLTVAERGCAGKATLAGASLKLCRTARLKSEHGGRQLRCWTSVQRFRKCVIQDLARYPVVHEAHDVSRRGLEVGTPARAFAMAGRAMVAATVAVATSVSFVICVIFMIGSFPEHVWVP
jgi:hypothetical protein